MSSALFVHRTNNLKCKIQGHEFLGHKETAESFREVVRMIDRRYIRTLTQLHNELKKRNLNG